MKGHPDSAVHPQDLVQQALALKDQHDPEGAIRCLRTAIHYDPSLETAYVDLAELFLMLDMPGQATYALQWAKGLCGESEKAIRLGQAARNLQATLHHTAVRRATVSGFTVVKYLGAGWEGSVYLVKDRRKTKWIVKAFHPGEVKQINYQGLGGVLRQALPSCRQSLESLAAASQQPNRPESVYPLELLTADRQVVGIKYPYEHAWGIDQEQKSHPSIQLSLLGAFFQTQAFLIKRCRLLLNDPVKGFMFNRKGSIRYIDYGRSIISIDDFRCGEDCLDAVSFFRFLFSIVKPTAVIRQTMQGLLYPSRNNRALLGLLLTEARHDATMKSLLGDLSPANLEIFHEAGFYEARARLFLANVSKFGKKFYSYKSILKHYAHQLTL